MFTANLLPGHGFQSFTVHVSKAAMSKTGRPMQGTELEETKHRFLGLLVGASQREIEQWKQNGHPISHKIIEYSALVKAKAKDYLVSDSGRQFYIQGIKNPGELNVTMIYYVEESLDVKKKVVSL